MKHLHYRRYCVALLPLLASAQASHAEINNWKKWTIDSSGNGADGVHIGDINRDGLVDVVSGWEQSGEIKLYLNPGPAKVREKAAWSATNISGGLKIKGIEDAAFADQDLDGFVETVVSSIEGDTKSLGIHWNLRGELDKPTSWRAMTLTPGHHRGYMKARAGQIDGSDGADIVAGTKTMDGEKAGIYWFRSPEKSKATSMNEWQRFLIGEIDVKTVSLVLRDMDLDNLLDVVYSGRNGVGWFRNPGSGALLENQGEAVWERVVIAETGSEFTFCDHDDDGREDIVIATSRRSSMVAKWLRRLDDSGRRWQEYPVASDDLRAGHDSGKKFVLKGVACGFVDGDEIIDLVFTASGDGRGVFMMSPRGDIRSDQTWNLEYLTFHADHMKYDNLRLVDIDGDSDLDIVTTEEGDGIFSSGDGVLWFENPLNTPATEKSQWREPAARRHAAGTSNRVVLPRQ